MSRDLSKTDITFYKNFAKKFVEIWDEFNSNEASLYAVEHVKKENFKLAEPYVTEEFLKRGYTF